ncbi:MAG: PQQ-binding-like beta-propeller repeat protein [Planctomycetota bacterium]
MSDGTWVVLRGGLLAWTLVLVLPFAELSAQVIFRGGGLRTTRYDAASAANNGQVFPRPERATLQALNAARQLIAERRFGEAVGFLDSVLESPEDFFFELADGNESSGGPRMAGIKAEAQRLTGAMPDEAIDIYRLRYGATAQRLLDEAVIDGDVEGLAAVSRRYFHTEAGYRATYLLGLHYFNSAQPLAAALSLQRLRDADRSAELFEPQLSIATATCWLQAGASDRCREVLLELKRSAPQAKLVLAGEHVSLFDSDSDAVQWLRERVGPERIWSALETDHWLLFRGNAARNAQCQGGAPLLNVRWRVPVAEQPLVIEALEQLRESMAESNGGALPGLHPLAVDDLLLMRTWNNLYAVDFRTGKRLWTVPVEDHLEDMVQKVTRETAYRQPQAWLGLAQRVWDDATFGTLSSDGRLVFSVEDLGAAPTRQGRRTVIVNGMPSDSAPPGMYNRLAAYDLRSGKLRWHLGGPADQFALRQAETFFLGPPLPLQGQLYVLAEVKGEGAIVLMALDAETGELLWTQSLAASETSLAEDALRRMSGLSPSYADGVLVCPTSAGAVVAVELSTRWLLWGFAFPRTDNQQPQFAFQFGSPVLVNQTASAWCDATVTLADGRALVTPRESNKVFCLDLFDGKLLWSTERKDDLYVAGVHDDAAVFVGRTHLRAIKLADGKPAWEGEDLILPEGSVPSGRGFQSGSSYFLPLSSAEVAEIDLSKGAIVQRAKARSGRVPGNLICHRDFVISQCVESVEAFHQLAPLREKVSAALAKDPNDPRALALHGEILLDQGEREAAVEAFQRSYAAERDPHTRRLLCESLLDGLREDFAIYRLRTSELEPLLETPAEQAAFVREMALGLQRNGEWSEALDHYLRLVDLPQTDSGLEEVSSTHRVSRSRWVEAQLASLLEEARGSGMREEIERRVGERLEHAMAHAEPQSLRRLVECFGHQQLGRKARLDLAQRLVAANKLLEAELLLWRDANSSDPVVAGPAVARIAAIVRKSGRLADAAWCYGQLEGRLADVPCEGQKTGREVLAEWPVESVARRAAEPQPWPQGLAEISTEHVNRIRESTYGRALVGTRQGLGPFFRGHTLLYDQNQRALFARSPFGEDRWHLSLGNQTPQMMVVYNRAAAEATAAGHLLVASLGDRLLAIDTLGSAEEKGARVVWEQSLANPLASVAAMRQFGANAFPWGIQTYYNGRSGMGFVSVGVASSRQICFQRFRHLTAVDPVTGEELWTQSGLPPGCELFGDDEMIFALPADSTRIRVYRAMDGQFLGERDFPRFKLIGQHIHTEQGPMQYIPLSLCGMATYGRRILLWHRDTTHHVLQLYDPWEQKALWGPTKFSVSAQFDLIGDEIAGVLESSGRLVAIELREGKTLFDVTLPLRDYGVQLTVDRTPVGYGAQRQMAFMRYDDRFLVLVNSNNRSSRSSSVRGERPRQIQPLPGVLSNTSPSQITNGYLFALAADGKLLWEKPAPIEYQFLVIDQPPEIPLLAFGCQEYTHAPFGGGEQNVRLTCVDKRNGRVYEHKVAGHTQTFDVLGDPVEHSVSLVLHQDTVKLKLTEKPLPPPEPAEDGKKNEASSTTSALMRVFGRLTEGLPPLLPEQLQERDE